MTHNTLETIISSEIYPVKIIKCYHNLDNYSYSIYLTECEGYCSLSTLIANSIYKFGNGEIANDRNELIEFFSKIKKFEYEKISFDEMYKIRPQIANIRKSIEKYEKCIKHFHIWNFSLFTLHEKQTTVCVIFHTSE